MCIGAFPSSQSFEEVKIAETSLAVANGADEIDIVLNLGYFLDHDYESLVDEITEQKEACRDGRLKVIPLETGALKTAKTSRSHSSCRASTPAPTSSRPLPARNIPAQA